MGCTVLPTADEETCIQAARNGDLEAFNTLVVAYQSQVYALAYRLLGETESAADVVQDTFLAAFQHIGTFRRGSLRAWLLRIAANLAYDALRRRRARPSSPLSIFIHADGVRPPHGNNKEDDPEDWVERQELASEIQRALETLPPEQRVVVVLCDIEDVPYAEAAGMLGISLGTLKSRLSRGRARLRTHFFDRRELLPEYLRFIIGRFAAAEMSPAVRQEDSDGSARPV